MTWAGVAVKGARNTGIKDHVRSRLRLGDGSHGQLVKKRMDRGWHDRFGG